MRRKLSTSFKIKIMKRNSIMFLFAFVFCMGKTIAQQTELDSLVSLLKMAKEDTNKVNLLFKLSQECNEDQILKYAESSLVLAQKLNYKMGIANAQSNVGYGYELVGKNDIAIDYYKKSLSIREEIKDKKGIGNSFADIGSYYYLQGNYSIALENFLKSLSIRKELKDKKGIAGLYNNIGLIYSNQGIYPKALEQYFNALKIKEEIGDKRAIASTLNNLGRIYEFQFDYSLALQEYGKALEIYEKLKSKRDIAMSLNNIGSVYMNRSSSVKNIEERNNDLDTALRYYEDALKIREEIGDEEGMATTYSNIGVINFIKADFVKELSLKSKYLHKALAQYLLSLAISEKNNSKSGIASSNINLGGVYQKQMFLNPANKRELSLKARKCLELALATSREIGYTEEIANSYITLSSLDSAIGDWQAAYNHNKLYFVYRDSLLNDENTKKTVKAQMNYEFDKKEEIARLEQEKKDELAAADLKRQKIISSTIVIGLLLVLLFAFIVVRSLRIANKQKKIIEIQKMEVEQQKYIVEEKQKEIIDSITYAKRIQKSRMPTEKYIEQMLNRLKKNF
ncbi:hypothetical protein BH10BAC1_BH10BAC1_21120 [soil metagenome]